MGKLKSRIIIYILISLPLYAICACGMEGYFYKKDLENSYSIVSVDAYEYTCVQKQNLCVIDWMIYSYGSDDRYIIAKQHPEKSAFDVDFAKTNWFIVDMVNDHIYGPMSENEFSRKRTHLGVPDTLDFIDTFDIEGK